MPFPAASRSHTPELLRPFVGYKYAVAARTSRLLGTGSPRWNTLGHVPLERPAVRRVTHRPRSAYLAIRAARRVGPVIALIALGGTIRYHVAPLVSAPKGVD
jgi:hypothetical protein